MKDVQARPLPPASILGVGAVTPIGRDLDAIARRLVASQTESADVLRVPDVTLSDPAINKRMRRADRFAKMTTLAALDAWSNAKSFCANISMQRVGLIVSTGFGPHGRGFKFLHGILDCGDDAALPTDFSHSVHGAAAAYITEILDLRGPSLNNTDFQVGFEECVQLAQCWLTDGTCDRVLIGAGEELGEVMLHCAEQMLPNDVKYTPSEGAVFFVLAPRNVTRIAEIDVTIGSSTGFLPVAEALHGLETRATRSVFGLNASSSAFELLNMVLMQREGRIDNAAAFTPSSTARTALILGKTS